MLIKIRLHLNFIDPEDLRCAGSVSVFAKLYEIKFWNSTFHPTPSTVELIIRKVLTQVVSCSVKVFSAITAVKHFGYYKTVCEKS